MPNSQQSAASSSLLSSITQSNNKPLTRKTIEGIVDTIKNYYCSTGAKEATPKLHNLDSFWKYIINTTGLEAAILIISQSIFFGHVKSNIRTSVLKSLLKIFFDVMGNSKQVSTAAYHHDPPNSLIELLLDVVMLDSSQNLRLYGLEALNQVYCQLKTKLSTDLRKSVFQVLLMKTRDHSTKVRIIAWKFLSEEITSTDIIHSFSKNDYYSIIKYLLKV
jgi:hypothetical protein